MKTLLVVMMLVSCSVFADGYRIYERYGYGNRYNPQVAHPDNVQLYIMQKQAERLLKSNEDYAVRHGLKDAWRGDSGGGEVCVSCGDGGRVYYGR